MNALGGGISEAQMGSGSEPMRARLTKSIESLLVEVGDLETLVFDLETKIQGTAQLKDRVPTQPGAVIPTSQQDNHGLLEAIYIEQSQVYHRLVDACNRLRRLSSYIG